MWVHYFMKEYPQLGEHDILCKDWDWVGRHSKLLIERENEHRRWDLQARLVAAAAGFNGGEAMEMYKELFDSTLSKEAIQQSAEAQFERENEAWEAERAARLEEYAAMKKREDDTRRYAAEREKQQREAWEAGAGERERKAALEEAQRIEDMLNNPQHAWVVEAGKELPTMADVEAIRAKYGVRPNQPAQPNQPNQPTPPPSSPNPEPPSFAFKPKARLIASGGGNSKVAEHVESVEE